MVASVKASICFHTGLRRLTWWWYCSPSKLQAHFCNKSGEGILEMGRAGRGVLPLKPRGWWRCWITVIVHFAWYPLCNTESPGKKLRNLETCPDTSQKLFQSFDLPESVPEPRLVFCHKQYQIKYIPNSTTQTNEEWNKSFIQVKLYAFHGSCFSPLKKSRVIKKYFKSQRRCDHTHLTNILQLCNVSVGETKSYAWAWLVKCWIWCSRRSFPTYVILWCYESMISWQRTDVQHRSPLNSKGSPTTPRVPHAV